MRPQFSSLEPEIVCRLVWVRAVEMVGPDGRRTPAPSSSSHAPAHPPRGTPPSAAAPPQAQVGNSASVRASRGGKGGGGKGGKQAGGRVAACAPPAAGGRGGGSKGGAPLATPDTRPGRHMRSGGAMPQAPSSTGTSAAAADAEAAGCGAADAAASCSSPGAGAGSSSGVLGGVGAASTELPSCPVCLERLDEYVSGIVTTVSGPEAGGASSSTCAVLRIAWDLTHVLEGAGPLDIDPPTRWRRVDRGELAWSSVPGLPLPACQGV